MLDELIAQCRPGWSLPAPFAADENDLSADIEQIWRRGWLFAGHTCEIPNPGDYFTVEVDTDSIIIIRGDDGAINGLYNVCRHRGSVLCKESAGHVGKIVCPYHQWVYARDGKLLSCRGMQEDLDRSQFGLHAVTLHGVKCRRV